MRRPWRDSSPLPSRGGVAFSTSSGLPWSARMAPIMARAGRTAPAAAAVRARRGNCPGRRRRAGSACARAGRRARAATARSRRVPASLAGGCGGVRLRVRMRKSLVLSLSTTVRPIRSGSFARRRPHLRRQHAHRVLDLAQAAGRARRCPRPRPAGSAARSPPDARRCPATARAGAGPSARSGVRVRPRPAGAAAPTVAMPSSPSFALHHLANAGQLANRQRREEGLDLRRLDHELAVGLAPVARRSWPGTCSARCRPRR